MGYFGVHSRNTDKLSVLQVDDQCSWRRCLQPRILVLLLARTISSNVGGSTYRRRSGMERQETRKGLERAGVAAQIRELNKKGASAKVRDSYRWHWNLTGWLWRGDR